VQETVIAVAKRIRELHYDPAVASFKTWLFQVVSRRIADQYRKRQRAGRVLEPLPDGSDARMIEQVADPSSMQPDAQWEREWEENILASALDRLKKRVSAAQYQIYDYHVVQRHGVRDTARHLGTKAAAVYLAKHRVGRLLRREVEQLRQTLV
jgi:RNA polymerase sigma-70 factor (ECF subfamily)